MACASSLACAIKDIASAQKSTFATTQAVWRFLNNDRISFSQLNDPIIALARDDIAHSSHQYALVVHDGSRLQFYSHPSKAHRLQMTHATDVGYERQSSLLLDATSGLPVAPLAQTLTDDTGHHSTLKEGHFVQHAGKTRKVSEVANALIFSVSGQIDYRGKKANIAVSETRVTITRAPKPKRPDKETGKRVKVQPGPPLDVRLVVVRLSDDNGKVLGRWTLLTNVEDKINRDEVAQWYYWRWNIESFFKLIKGAGHDVESWLERSAQAVLRRLLIASMACVLAWRVQRASGEENARVGQLICRLSGRYQKRGRMESAPAILAGLSVLLNALTLLSEYSPEELTRLAARALGQFEDV